MFPLGTVLFPGGVLPLHVFEPRYVEMLTELMDGPGEFGVVLIERGNEVGGGDARSDVGTMARVVDAERVDDERWAMVAVGLRRIRVVEWLTDDPYPRAEVQDWPDHEPVSLSADAVSRDLESAVNTARELVGTLHGGLSLPPVELGDDPVLAVYNAASATPLGDLDRQSVLAAADATTRLAVVRTLVQEQIELLQARIDLSGGGTNR